MFLIWNGECMDVMERRIIDAAMEVFSENGYKGSTTKKIAEKGNINEVTLFRRFKSKENLLKVVIKEKESEAIEALDSILLMEKNEDIQTCLTVLGENVMDFLEERMDFILMLISEGRNKPEIGKILSNAFFEKNFKHLGGYFQEQIEMGKIRKIDPNFAAFTYMSYIFYSKLLNRINPELREEKEFEEFMDLFLNGIIKG